MLRSVHSKDIRSMMKDVTRELVKIFTRCLPAVMVCLASALLIYLDVVIFGRDCSEGGVVEMAQALFALVLIVTMTVIVRHRPDLRGGTWLALGFFLDVFIREQDAFLDDICHGFWIWPAIIVVVFAICMAFRHRETLVAFFAQIRTSRHFNLLALGMSVLLIFSRIFGNKVIWRAVVGNDDYRVAKHVAEEGVELIGYAILVLWAIGFCRECICTGRRNS